MDLLFNPYSFTLIFSGLLVACLSLIIAYKIEDGTKWMAITMILGAIWGGFYGLELSATTLDTILVFVKIQYLGISFLAASWVIFALKYTEIDLNKHKAGVFFIFLIPILTFIFVLTNDYHHLYYKSFEIVFVNEIYGLKSQVGPWYIIHVMYSYLAFAFGNFIIWIRFRHADSIFKAQTKLIFVAGLFPIVFNTFYQFGIYKPFELIDLTPYAFLFTYFIIGLAILRYYLFTIKPIAKNIIFNAITKGVLVLDSNQKIIDLNTHIFTFLKDKESAKIGSYAKTVFDSYPELINLLTNSEKTNLVLKQRKGGKDRFTSVEIIPLNENGRKQNGTILIFEDITEEINTKELLIGQKTELEQLNNLKDKYFSIISHDLKGPIFGVKELIHLTQTGIISVEEFIEMLPEISKNMENVSQLLENLLAWTSSQLRGEQVNLEVFNIIKVISQQKQLLDRIATEKNISINIDILETDLPVIGDKNMVELILRNLINNALKFSKSSSQIILSAKIAEGYTKICIQDFGTGISEENLTKINNGVSFTTKGQSNENGTGLGLILVQEYIKKNSGRLEVTSIEGEGSKFCISLPTSIS